ncbi:MAG TPA: MarR family transcriptional regulator [Rhizobiales bacterium]|nr:MarR family transcriptional regulator [Hyphomicrobiales bacterium]
MAIARPTHRRLFAVFDHAHGHLSRRVGKALAGAGVRPAQAMALVYLGYHNGCQLSELAEGIGSGNAAATGLIDRMEKSGLVARKKLQSDGRGRTVHLLPKGLEVREQVMDVLRDFDDRLAARFTDREINIITRFLALAASGED